MQMKSVLMSAFLGACLSGGSVVWSHGLPVPPEMESADQHSAETASGLVLFENVRIFDGVSPQLSEPGSVLVRDGIIEKVSAGNLLAEGARIIDGAGRTLMPGLIDVHWHSMFVGVPINVALTADYG